MKTIKLLPKGYEIFISEEFQFHCQICEEKKANKKLHPKEYQEKIGSCVHFPFCKFIDSLNFLQGSLSNLTAEMKNSCSEFLITGP